VRLRNSLLTAHHHGSYCFSITLKNDKEQVMGVTRSGTFTASSLEGLLLAAIVVVAVLGVLRSALGPAGLGLGTGPVFGGPPTVEVTLDTATVNIDTDPELPTLADRTIEAGVGTEFLVPTGTKLAVYTPDWRQRLALAGTPVLGGLLGIGVLGLLLHITRTLRRGDPFVASNARRLYVIAALVGIGGQAVVALTAWGRLGILRHPEVAPYVLTDVSTTIVPLLAGFGIAVAAEVFRQGARLKAEVEGLV
jgi:hypothetical protein